MTALALLLQQPPHVRETIERPPAAVRWLDRFMEWALQEVPQSVQQLGVPLAAVVAAIVIALVVWKRRAIAAWWRRRGPRFKLAVLAAAAVLLIGAAGTGAYVWDYVQHDNDFCNSCHVMHEPFERFQQSEHSELSCHDCHQQSMAASLRQLRLWVANRPTEVGPHAPVPTQVCAECHITEDPDSTWQRISATAGHRVHLEADTGALKDVMCVTCHGKEVHRFAPVDETCGQSACHEPAKTQIVLGDMTGQTGMHCVICHVFTAPVTETAPLDTVRAALIPALAQCGSCHEMEKVLAGLDPEKDPHDAVCGTCHNPHTQEIPAVAATRCAECHAPAEELTPFHRGLRAAVVEDCVGCHQAHSFAVAGDDCLACHADIVGGTPTTGPGARPGGRADATPPAAEPTFRLVSSASVLAVTRLTGQRQQPRFNHRDHRDIQCTECHTSRRTHGEVTLESRAQCLECHHSRQVAGTAAGCARCHGGSELARPRPVEVVMSIRGQSRSRRVGFDHGDHPRLACAACHTQGVSLGVARTCASCHENHHTAAADCTTCHGTAALQAHTREVHTRSCAGSACHELPRYGAMAVGRNTCLACHVDMNDHRPGQACAACHRVTFASGATSASPGRR